MMEISNSKSNDPYCIKFLIVSYGNTRVMPTIFFVLDQFLQFIEKIIVYTYIFICSDGEANQKRGKSGKVSR